MICPETTSIFDIWSDLVVTSLSLVIAVPMPGQNPKLETIELSLEDLLELQHLRDPVCRYYLD